MLILGRHRAPEPYDPIPTDPRSPVAQLGHVDAYERVDARQMTVVRSALLSASETYAVSLSVDSYAIDDHVYRLFDLACRSIRYESP